MSGKNYAQLYQRIKRLIVRGAKIADGRTRKRVSAARIHDWINETHDCLVLLKDEMPKELSDFLRIRPNFEFKAYDDRKVDYNAEAEEDDDDAFISKSEYRPHGINPRTGMTEVADVLLDFNFEYLKQANDILKGAAGKLEIEGHSFPDDPSDEKLGEELRADSRLAPGRSARNPHASRNPVSGARSALVRQPTLRSCGFRGRRFRGSMSQE